MVRPIDKQQLLNAGETKYNKLMQMIEELDLLQQEGIFSFEDRDKNIRDVLAHLYEWHKLLLNWERLNKSGQKSDFLLLGYNWKTYPKMNIIFWENHQNTPLSEIKKRLKHSHEQVMLIIRSYSTGELFTKKWYPWTGTTNLASYCISATSSHYDWAMKKVKKYIKSL